MSNNRGERRSRQPNLVQWIDESPANIMQSAWLRTRKAVSADHHRLRRIWSIRNEWLSRGEKCGGKIPPGAFRRQKSGNPWIIEPDHMSQYPVAEVNTCYIYALTLEVLLRHFPCALRTKFRNSTTLESKREFMDS